MSRNIKKTVPYSLSNAKRNQTNIGLYSNLEMATASSYSAVKCASQTRCLALTKPILFVGGAFSLRMFAILRGFLWGGRRRLRYVSAGVQNRIISILECSHRVQVNYNSMGLLTFSTTWKARKETSFLLQLHDTSVNCSYSPRKFF